MKATPSDKQNNDPKERLERKIFQQIALFGSAFLLKKWFFAEFRGWH